MEGQTITVRRSKLYPSRPRAGFAWAWLYETTGPDGRRFDNKSIVELRRVLRARYPGARIEEEWK